MAFFEGWPYTNFHDCNLDWVMETTRKVHVEVHQLHQELHRAINCEEQQRIDADVKLGERIDKEITDRTEADNALGARIDKEIQDRVDAVQAEEEARIAADNALGARIDKEISDRQQADNALQDAINAEESARQDAINSEATARQAADAKLQQGIDAEAAARAQAVTAEAEARAAADTALGQRIDAESADRTQAVNAEATARQQADAALGARIDKEVQDRTAKDAELETAIANEATTRANAITDLRDDLTHEISDREAGDDALVARIDGITPQLLPAGGTQGQVLGKSTGDDYAVAWQDPAAAVNGLPEGGTAGQILAKKGPDNFDAEWINAPEGGGTGEDPNAIRKDGTTVTTAAIPFAMGIQTPSITGTGMEGVAIEANLDLNNHAITSLLPGTDEFDAVTVSQLNDKFADAHSIPAGGTAGQVLGKIDDTDYNVTWVNQTGGGEGGTVPAGGTTGQVLAKSTDADYQTEWVNQTGGLPEGGTVGQVLAKKTADNYATEWINIPQSSDSNAVKVNADNTITTPYTWTLGYPGGPKLTFQKSGPETITEATLKSASHDQKYNYVSVNRNSITINAEQDHRSYINLYGDSNGIAIVHDNTSLTMLPSGMFIKLPNKTPNSGQVLAAAGTNGELTWTELGANTEIPTGVEGLKLWINNLTRTAFWEFKATISSVTWSKTGVFTGNTSYYFADKILHMTKLPPKYYPKTEATISLGFCQTHTGFGEGQLSMVDRIVTIRSNALRIEYALLFNGNAPNTEINDQLEFTMVTRF